MKIFELTSTGDPYTLTDGDKYYRAVYDEHIISVKVGNIFCLEERDEDWLKCHKNLMVENDKVVRWRCHGQTHYFTVEIDATEYREEPGAYVRRVPIYDWELTPDGHFKNSVDQRSYDSFNMYATEELAKKVAHDVNAALKKYEI